MMIAGLSLKRKPMTCSEAAPSIEVAPSIYLLHPLFSDTFQCHSASEQRWLDFNLFGSYASFTSMPSKRRVS